MQTIIDILVAVFDMFRALPASVLAVAQDMRVADMLVVLGLFCSLVVPLLVNAYRMDRDQ